MRDAAPDQTWSHCRANDAGPDPYGGDGRQVDGASLSLTWGSDTHRGHGYAREADINDVAGLKLFVYHRAGRQPGAASPANQPGLRNRQIIGAEARQASTSAHAPPQPLKPGARNAQARTGFTVVRE